MPAWIAWLIPVPLATLSAVAWASWSSRTRGPVGALESVEAHERFRAAMTAPVPSPVPAPRETRKSRAAAPRS